MLCMTTCWDRSHVSCRQWRCVVCRWPRVADSCWIVIMSRKARRWELAGLELVELFLVAVLSERSTMHLIIVVICLRLEALWVKIVR